MIQSTTICCGAFVSSIRLYTTNRRFDDEVAALELTEFDTLNDFDAIGAYKHSILFPSNPKTVPSIPKTVPVSTMANAVFSVPIYSVVATLDEWVRSGNEVTLKEVELAYFVFESIAYFSRHCR